MKVKQFYPENTHFFEQDKGEIHFANFTHYREKRDTRFLPPRQAQMRFIKFYDKEHQCKKFLRIIQMS